MKHSTHQTAKALFALIAGLGLSASTAATEVPDSNSETTLNAFKLACSSGSGQVAVEARAGGGYTAACIGSPLGPFVLTSTINLANSTWRQSAVFDRQWTAAARRMTEQLNTLRAAVVGLRATVSSGLLQVEYQVGAHICEPIGNEAWKCCAPKAAIPLAWK